METIIQNDGCTLEEFEGKYFWLGPDGYSTSQNFPSVAAAEKAMDRELKKKRELGLDSPLANAGVLKWDY